MRIDHEVWRLKTRAIAIVFYGALLLIAAWFSKDLLTGYRALAHQDFLTFYYPYREWFTDQLIKGSLPLWNPFMGLGTTSQLWSTIPVDLFTVLRLIVGPHYHYFQFIQAFALLSSVYFVGQRLGYARSICILSSVLFFFSPWVSYFYFYFIKFNSFIAAIFLFFLFYRCFESSNKRYLVGIFVVTFLSFWGTKAEFWFYHIVVFSFYPIVCWLVIRRTHFRKLVSVYVVYTLGVVANLWIINFLSQVFEASSRKGSSSLLHIFSMEMYRNLFLSILESPIWHFILLASVLWFASMFRRTLEKVIFLFCCVGVVYLLPFDFQLSRSLFDNLADPFLIGGALAVVLALTQRESYKEGLYKFAKTNFIYFIFVIYWCRSGRGDLGENEILNLAPYMIPGSFGFFLWYGCQQFWTNKLAKVAIITIVILFVVREQGQILLTYLAGLVWMPTRDNYLFDILSTLVAMVGMGSLFNKYRNKLPILPPVLVILVLVAVLMQTSKDFYYSHALMSYMPDNYPYHKGIPEVTEVLKRNQFSPNTRFYLQSPEFYNTFGMGSLITESLPQVTMYTSIAPRRYFDWTVFRNYGIPPANNVIEAYPNEYTERTIRRLPKITTNGLSNTEIYHIRIVSRPSFDQNSLQLLGVKYVGVLIPIEDENDPQREKKINSYIEQHPFLQYIDHSDLFELPYMYQRGPGQFQRFFFVVSRVKRDFPRVYVIGDADGLGQDEIKWSMDATLSDDGNHISTPNYSYPVYQTAKIVSYEPEKISIIAKATAKSHLVLSDIYHPFWEAYVNGQKVEIVPVFHVFRGVQIERGIHRVTFRLKVPWFYEAVGLSIAFFLLGIFCLICISRFWRRIDSTNPAVL
mgnify:FL=1